VVELAFGGGFVLGLLLGLVCLDRYYKIYIRQIVDELYRSVRLPRGNKA
jgi:hypothetical protein